MKITRLLVFVCLFFVCVSAQAQISTWALGFDRSVNAASARAYLGINTNGGGGVSSFSADPLAGLFNVTVLTPTTTPHLQFSFQSQTANLVLASPNGSPGVPSFRALTLADLPDITSLVRGDVSGTAPVNYSSGSGVFSMHAADASHNGYLSAADYNTFSTGSGGGTEKIDILMTNASAYANGTNFNVDFNWSAQTMQPTGDIAFNYSTNWGLANTSRVCNVFIPATNFLRYVYFLNAATNWHPSTPLTTIPPMRAAKMSFQLFGTGETNVSLITSIDSQNAAGLPQVYDLTTVTTGTNILLLDASLNGLYDDHLLTLPSMDGQEVRGWKDASGQGNNVTNFTTIYNGLTFHNAMSAPFNIPCLQMGFSSSANTWLKSGAISKLTQPITVFFLYHSFNTVMTVADGASGATAARMATQVSLGGSVVLASQNASSISGTTVFTPNYVLFTYVFNGASSTIRTNAAAVVSGTVANVTPTSLTMFSDISATQPQTIGYVPEVQIWWGALSAADRGNIETNYFRAKYRVW